MSCKPDHAFILAAGKGTRLRPYTDSAPKPMVAVGGRTLIDRTLDKLEEAGVTHVTVNLHYMADILEAHLAKRGSPAITLSHEPDLLDTGGGVKKALRTLGEKPFYVIAGDNLWTDGPSGNALLRLAAAWDDARMDILTLMQPLSGMVLTQGLGDYDLRPALGELELPTIVLHGDCDPIPATTAETTARLLKASFHLIPHCGHVPYVEAHEEFVTLLDGFLPR